MYYMLFSDRRSQKSGGAKPVIETSDRPFMMLCVDAYDDIQLIRRLHNHLDIDAVLSENLNINMISNSLLNDRNTLFFKLE